jgi:hypothetical protein
MPEFFQYEGKYIKGKKNIAAVIERKSNFAHFRAIVTCGVFNDLASAEMAYETKDELVFCYILVLLNSSGERKLGKK